jgi:hypothetical protein
MKPLFQEKQRFTQWWLWVIIVAAAVFVVGLFGKALYQQFILGTPWGDKPMSDDALLVLALFNITAVTVMLLIFFNAMLEIMIDKSSVTYRYFPLIRNWKRIERENVLSFQVRKNYLTGYGMHRDLKGNKIINVKGHDVIEIMMNDGSKLTLGTQQPDEFLQALQQMKDRREN